MKLGIGKNNETLFTFWLIWSSKVAKKSIKLATVTVNLLESATKAVSIPSSCCAIRIWQARMVLEKRKRKRSQFLLLLLLSVFGTQTKEPVDLRARPKTNNQERILSEWAEAGLWTLNKIHICSKSMRPVRLALRTVITHNTVPLIPARRPVSNLSLA